MNTVDKVIEIVSTEVAKNSVQVKLESTLLGELQIDGDDAWELIEACQQEFNIDLSNFEFQKYFRNEPCYKWPLYYFRKYKYGDEHVAARKHPLTVSQLIRVCEKGMWQIDV